MKTVSFYGTCEARSEKTLVTPRISTGYKIMAIHATFPLGCINLLSLSFYHSIDANAPSAGKPSGVSILMDYGQVDYVVGDGQKKEMQHECEMHERGSFLKVYANNTDFFAHAIDVQIFIEPT